MAVKELMWYVIVALGIIALTHYCWTVVFNL